MKTNKLFFLLLIVAFAFLIVGCESDDDKEINEFNVLLNYIEDNDRDWITDMSSWVMPEDPDKYDDYLILDLRDAATFAATPNPIPGAINTTLAEMFDVVEANAKTSSTKIWVTCYSGQTAAYGHMLLRLKGYEAYSMKWGMSLHSADTDSWSNVITGGSKFVGHSDWVFTASPTLPDFDYPELNTGEETGEAILDARIDAAIAAWPTMVNSDDVMNNLDGYNIINYWIEDDYLGMGHFSGAYQVTPFHSAGEKNLHVFDDKGTNVFYCYTGQTAAAACAYLTVLGYDVKSISKGCNSMIYDGMTKGKWTTPTYIN